jgi:subtilase family serine protease
MRTSTRLRAVAASGAVLAAVATMPALASVDHGSPAVTSLVSAIPSWALHAKPAAAEPGTARVDVALLLRGRDTDALQRFDAAVSNPASASYRHFLTQAQYAARFAPTAAEASATRGWLRSAGLTVDGTTPNNTLVYAHAPAATVARAFQTKLALFKVAGKLLRAPLVQPTVPASLRSTVTAVAGLAQSDLTPSAPPAPAFVNARPCSGYYGQKTATKQPTYAGKHLPYAVCGYTPKQLRSAYGVNHTTQRGKGATVAIVDAFASPTVEADANRWSKLHGIAGFSGSQFSQHLYPGASDLPEANVGGVVDFDPQGWQGEETLDVEAVHAMAPAAKVIYYAATNVAFVDPGLYVAETEAVEDGKAQIVSNSWGLPDDSPLPTDQILFNTVANEAAAEGVTLDFSSGDDGDEVANLGERSADFPATSPQVTAVGGTTLEVSRTGKRLGETYWGTEKIPLKKRKWDFKDKIFSGAGGGGNSTTYPEPAWQKPVVPSGEATFGGVRPGRVVPDVAMDADPTTGILIGETMTFANGKVKYAQYRLGGTSVACPLFSGLVALAVGKNHGKGLGDINPTLYAHSKAAAGLATLFNDPTGVKRHAGRSLFANVRPDYADTANPKSAVAYSLRTLGNLGTLHRRKGYDDSTGLGSPKAPALVRLLG